MASRLLERATTVGRRHCHQAYARSVARGGVAAARGGAPCGAIRALAVSRVRAHGAPCRRCARHSATSLFSARAVCARMACLARGGCSSAGGGDGGRAREQRHRRRCQRCCSAPWAARCRRLCAQRACCAAKRAAAALWPRRLSPRFGLVAPRRCHALCRATRHSRRRALRHVLRHARHAIWYGRAARWRQRGHAYGLGKERPGPPRGRNRVAPMGQAGAPRSRSRSRR